jgi:hypothetical protein
MTPLAALAQHDEQEICRERDREPGVGHEQDADDGGNAEADGRLRREH